MKIITKIIVGLGSIILLPISTATVVSVPYGWYFEGNAGYSNITGADFTGLPNTTSNGWVGYNGNAGYKFMPFFALEGGYTRYANVKVGKQHRIARFDGVTIKQYSYDAAAKGILPITCTPVELFSKLGWASTHSSTSNFSQSASSVFFGIGGDYVISPNIAANLQWQRAVGNNKTGKSDLYSLGVSYIFA